MVKNICIMCLTILPLVLSGILNMVFTKTSLYKKYKAPIDMGKTYIDERRIFGDNKTWIGFVSMILFSALTHLIIGLFLDLLDISQYSDLYLSHKNSPFYNLFIGALFGFSYMIAELPNSFIKRRLDIKPGQTAGGIKGTIFFVVDQIDSLIGIALLIYFLSDISLMRTVNYIVLGTATHITVNLILFSLKVRKNI